jgi:carbamate kinase
MIDDILSHNKNVKKAVVALGGNAISNRDREDTIPHQFENTYASLGSIVELTKDGYQLAITHGNGPQVGNALLRVELAKRKAPILPLYICVADLQGGMGYMITQCLQNRLKKEGIDRDVVTLVSQVLVDEDDPAFENPTKFIGQFYDEKAAGKLHSEMGWKMAPFPGDKRWRRVVPSPKPLRLIERETIKRLLDNNSIVVAAGGGGIPVFFRDGKLFGVDAVIDKDLAAAVMARDIGAELLIIFTDIEKVAINFGRPDQKNLDEVTLAELKAYRNDEHFPPGSMGPKIEAAISFLENGGREVVIGSIGKGFDSIKGQAGTRIIP